MGWILIVSSLLTQYLYFKSAEVLNLVLIHNSAFFRFKCFVVFGQILYVLSKNTCVGLYHKVLLVLSYRIVLIAVKI